MSLIDLFREFHRDAIQREFPPSTRVLFYTLLGEFNAARWPDKLVLSERDLIQLTNLKKTTLHDAKRYLTSRHIIECKPFKNKDAYYFGDEARQLLLKEQPTTNRPLTDQSPTTSRPVSDVPYIRACEDYQDVKTYSSLTSPRARAQAGAPVNEEAEPAEDLARYWSRTLGGARLSFEDISWLDSLVQKHGYEWTKGLMDEAYNANGNPYGLAPKWLKLVYDRRLNPPKPKGGERIGRNREPAGGFDLSGTDAVPDWAERGATAGKKQGTL